eukprot:1930987-Pleurochrysis_carterae.AAC.1
MVTLRPCRALLRSSFLSYSPLARPRIQAAVPSAWPRMTPARVSSRLTPARTSCARPRAKRRSEPVLVIGMPLKRSQPLAVMLYLAAQMPPGRNSAVWLCVAAAIAVKAADS